MSVEDSQVGWLANAGMQYLVSGQAPERLGNEHPSIVALFGGEVGGRLLHPGGRQ